MLITFWSVEKFNGDLLKNAFLTMKNRLKRVISIAFSGRNLARNINSEWIAERAGAREIEKNKVDILWPEILAGRHLPLDLWFGTTAGDSSFLFY
jgi:hypothetical protein